MNAPGVNALGPAPDEALLSRIQQDNQRQILGKLLHDLRNPVHSIRISMELFGRLARRQGDVEKLFARAGAYIGPAEAAVDQLQHNTGRLATYLSAPTAPIAAPLDVMEWLVEIATLLKGARRKLQVAVEPFQGDVPAQISADRARISHALLHWCLNHECAAVTLAIRPGTHKEVSEEVRIEASSAPGDPSHTVAGARAQPLTPRELAALLENAGGSVSVSERALSLRFRRCAPESP